MVLDNTEKLKDYKLTGSKIFQKFNL